MDIKEEVKEESSFPEFCTENKRELFIQHPVKKVKIETVTSNCDIKPELEDPACSQNEEGNLLRFNETIKEREIETKLDIKEELWLEGDGSCINDEIMDETHEDFYSKKPSRSSKDNISSYTSDLFSIEDSGNDIRVNMSNDSPECESNRICERQESVVINISSVGTSICSEISNGAKVFTMASPSNQSKLLQQRNTNKQDINKDNYKSDLSCEYRNSDECDIFETCLEYLCHLETNICNICNQAFTYPSHLKRHKVIHEGIKPHKCDICSKTFTQLYNLKRHKFIHGGTRPHKCNICNKAFTRLSSLKEHKCNKAFTESSNLKEHKLIHEGVRPHKCNICNKAFTKLSSLKSHNLIHEGIKPHKCNICNKAFTQLSHLKRHKFIHEGIKPHQSDICNKPFTGLCLEKQIHS